MNTNAEATEIVRGASDGLGVGRTQRAAAFFDVDGTLCALPSLESRFFMELWRRGRIPARNVLVWVREAARLFPQGIEKACRANKRHLRGISIETARSAVEAMQRRILYFDEAIERVCWHAERGHAIVLVTGTLHELAVLVAIRLKQELALAGCSGEILICATQLEEREGRWSGGVLGEVMRGRGKAAAMKRLAERHSWKLAECWAYGDDRNDRWMLDAVGHGVAVNPRRTLAKMAREYGWLEMRWNSSRRSVRSSDVGAADRSAKVERSAGQAA